MSSELGLDPSDPLNMLLHNVPQDSSMEGQEQSAPIDWTELAAMLSNQNSMDNSDGMKLNFNLGDIDFSQAMAVEPTKLHFDDEIFYQPQTPAVSYSSPQELLSASFPFTFLCPDADTSLSDFGDSKARRLSITSSSSGASLSPIMDHASPINLAEQLAERVRQSSGVTLAVSAGVRAPQPIVSDPITQAKLPIPRLHRPKISIKPKKTSTKSAPSSVPSSNAGTPPPSDATSPGSSPGHSPPAATVLSASGRPKTSHTTIERRYRTNLNARIQSLKMAVPALRVLEEKTHGKDSEYVVDERGFVDGVKVARKGSKANILGKAVEYIRVLKKREARLKREQNGLRSLLSGLVGGPALLKEWEREWITQFGGDERDEVEGEEIESDDDDGDGDGDEEGDNDDGRAKKKVKVVKTPKPERPGTEEASSGPPEKRKRGRPRKNAIPVAVAVPVQDTSSVSLSGPPAQLQPPAQQYLFAVFALFSFFNSPLTNTSPSAHPHTHSGSVLTSTPVVYTTTVPSVYGWRDLIHAFHLLVTILVFFSIVVPWLPRAMNHSRLLSRLLSPLSSLTLNAHALPKSTPSHETNIDKDKKTDVIDCTSLADALSSACRGSTDEATDLRDALGVSSGILGLVQTIFTGGKRKSESFEQRQLEQRAWVRLGELVAMDSAASTATRLQTYWCMRSHISWFKASTSDLSTLALILYPIARVKAEVLWARALKTDFVRPFERLVLQTTSLGEATALLGTESPICTMHAPLGVLAETLVRTRTLQHAAALFVQTVLPENERMSGNAGTYTPGTQDADGEERFWRVTIDAGKSLGGSARELCELFERVWDTGMCTVADANEEGERDERDIRALLNAVVLYRRIFPSAIMSCAGPDTHNAVSFILSPPPSPSRKNASLHLALRQALGSAVFDGDAESGVALEDARDRVVDMLVDCERAVRGRGGKARSSL